MTAAAMRTPERAAGEQGPRITFVSTTRGGGWGGRASLLEIVAGLRRLGADVRLLTPEPELATQWRSETGGRARVIRLPSAGRPLAVAVAARLLAIPSTSIVVLFDPGALRGSALLARLLGRPRRRTFVDVHFKTEARRDYFERMTRHLHGAICVSDFVARPIQDACPTHVVWRPIRAADSGRDRRADSPVTIGLLGRMDRVKRVDLGIRAAAGLAETGVRVVMRGAPYTDDGAYLREATALGAELLGDRFAYEGRVPQARALDGIDVLLHCNPDEASGRSVAEAQMAARVVVVPRQGGAAEFVSEGATGFVYEAGDADSMIAALARAVDAVRSGTGIGASARAFARERYDVAEQCRRYLDALLGLDGDTP